MTIIRFHFSFYIIIVLLFKVLNEAKFVFDYQIEQFIKKKRKKGKERKRKKEIIYKTSSKKLVMNEVILLKKKVDFYKHGTYVQTKIEKIVQLFLVVLNLVPSFLLR